ncbi:hypothetical protein GDO81_002324 [Engystomops pustulosus]|uniref:Uncharacterized protein n=1 Tax=Engystomops pustulosus TaxID=76066 RepID=A0AAV7DNC8_ENGPU|nr:hypothetical protein GDO81_002324 [Engystomops pustulosus]
MDKNNLREKKNTLGTTYFNHCLIIMRKMISVLIRSQFRISFFYGFVSLTYASACIHSANHPTCTCSLISKKGTTIFSIGRLKYLSYGYYCISH